MDQKLMEKCVYGKGYKRRYGKSMEFLGKWKMAKNILMIGMI